MRASVLVITALVVVLARVSYQEPIPEGRGYQGGGGGGSGGYLPSQGGSGGHGGQEGGFGGQAGGYGGQGGGFGGQGGGFGGQGGASGSQGRGGSGGADGRYGFNIVDTDDRYGYESNIPGAKANFFLLGSNRGPGAKGGW